MSSHPKEEGAGWVVVTIVRGRNFSHNSTLQSLRGSTLGVNPFAVLHVDGENIGSTSTQTCTANPVWKERYVVPIKKQHGTLLVEVFDLEIYGVYASLGHFLLDPFQDGDAAAKWCPLSGNEMGAEIFLTYRRSFGLFGSILEQPKAFSYKDPGVPPLDLFNPLGGGECKRNIVRMSTHLYYCMVPYWWLSERWMWTNPVESAIIFVSTTLGLYYGYFLAMVCTAMALYLTRNYIQRASTQHEPPPKKGVEAFYYPDPFAIFRAFDDLQKQLLYVSIYTNWIGDIYEYYSQIFCWERPVASRKLFSFLVAWTFFGWFECWPSMGTMLALVNVYLFTLYPLYYKYPNLYKAITTLAFLPYARGSLSQEALAVERSAIGELMSHMDAADCPVHSTPIVIKNWNFVSALKNIDQHLQSGATVCSFACKTFSELYDVERKLINSFINVSSFADESTENFVPKVDAYSMDDTKQFTAILAKTMYIVPNVTADMFTRNLLASFEYQNACQPGNKVISPDESPGYIRFTKTILHMLSITAMFKVSQVTDEAALGEIQRCMDPELHPIMSLDRVLLLERTKRTSSKIDATAKAKSILLYRTLPHGVLVTNMTCVLNTSINSLMSRVVNNLASMGSSEAAETAQRTRAYFQGRAAKSSDLENE